jgi:hypothetical protein
MARKRQAETAVAEEPQLDPLPAPESNGEETTSSRPVFTTRLGKVIAAVWKNEAPNGGHFFSAKVYRIYKREGDDTWYQTNSLGPSDCLQAAEALRQAAAFMYGELSNNTPF